MEQLGVQLEQAAELDLSIATIEKIEKGTRSLYDYEVVAFAKVLKVELAQLLETKSTNPNKT